MINYMKNTGNKLAKNTSKFMFYKCTTMTLMGPNAHLNGFKFPPIYSFHFIPF